MKFSSVLSILLAGLAVASPLVQPQGSSDLSSRDVEIEHHLVTRVDDTVSDEYKKVHSAKSDIQDGKFYAFNVKCEQDLELWRIGTINTNITLQRAKQ